MPFTLFKRTLTGDCSAPAHATEADIDRRVNQMVEMEDPDIVPDMIVHNGGRKAVFDPLWSTAIVMTMFSTWLPLLSYMTCGSKQKAFAQRVP